MADLIKTFYKDADETTAYTLNWVPALNSSTISSASWSVPSGLTTSATSNTTTTASIRVSGGSPGERYRAECTVTTAASEVLQAAIEIVVDN